MKSLRSSGAAPASSLNPFLIENFPPAGNLATATVETVTHPRNRSNVWESDMALFSRAFVRRRAISLAASLSVSATSLALAQSPGDARHLHEATNDRNERQFLFAKDLAVSDMSRASLAQPTGNVDRDFITMMIPQDQATIGMARAELQYGHNVEIRRLAQAIVAQQEQEISMMHRAMGDAASTRPQHVPTRSWSAIGDARRMERQP